MSDDELTSRPPLYAEDPQASVAYWSRIVTDPSPELIQHLEKPHDGRSLDEFEVAWRSREDEFHRIAADARQPLRVRLDAAAARRRMVKTYNEAHGYGDDPHPRWMMNPEAPIVSRREEVQTQKMYKELRRAPCAQEARKSIARGVRLIKHRRRGGERRPGARRIASRSAGGGSSGDPDGAEPGELARRSADDDVAGDLLLRVAA